MDKEYKVKPFYCFIKRCFDILCSFLAIIVLSPLLIILTILVPLTSKGSPFYLDKRLGKNKKIIRIIKFRSMKNDTREVAEILSEEEYKEYVKTFKLENDPRTTKFGRFLRKTSLDELPQLFNILKGDLSFVGPRPIVEKEYEHLWDNNEEIFKVKPGLTGYWAVNGRSNTSYEERIKLEQYYVIHRSLWLDFKILVKTFFVAISGKGAL
ncbi:MAG: sugar transferase [Bacilli bacterium]|nr:sugar transferase [Bacilli bacterium]